MTYRNRNLVRKPLAMLRVNPIEAEKLEFLVEVYGGGEPSAVFRDLLLKLADAKSHERNSLSPSRLDKSSFGSLSAA